MIHLRITQGRMGGQLVSAVLMMMAAAALAIAFEQFRTAENLGNLFVQAAPLLLVALGQTFVVLINGLDLSVGVMVSLATAILAVSPSPLIGLSLVFIAAVVLGLVNGIGVGYFRVHPIIMTLASATILQGVVLLILPEPGGSVSPSFALLANSWPGGIPLAIGWIAIASLMAWYILHRSRFGLHVFSVGGAQDNAALAGVKVIRVQVACYILSALFAATAGIFLAGRIASGDPWVGATYSLDSIAAVTLGGTQLTGGIGGVLGTLFGTLLLGLVGNGMNLVQVNPFLLSVVNGALLLFAVCLRRRQQMGL